MTETKKKIEIFGHPIDVSDVPVVQTKEEFVEYKLEDGTVLKVKGVASSILRVDNQFLPDGSPIYIVMLNPVVSVVSSPLKREPQEPAARLAEAKKVH
jgi:hypothetical protein